MKTKDPILRHYDGRCNFCYMRSEYCICSLIPEILINTYVTVVMHHRESYKTTNSARIACMALSNSKIVLHGMKDHPIDQDKIIEPGYQPMLLTLNKRSQVLDKELLATIKQPIQLIVPDGNWRQARKMGQRIKPLNDPKNNVIWVKLAAGPKSVYRLRREHLPEGLSTLEAISRALTVLESPAVEEKLMSLFNTMVERTLATRPGKAER
ncbi:MAG: tRNA-uridine aminocarboxypropyltransferase [Bdellovibrionales bacterium]